MAQGFRGFAWAHVPGQTILVAGVCGKGDGSVPGAQEAERDWKWGAQPSEAGPHNLLPPGDPRLVSMTSPSGATFYQSWGHSLYTEKPSLATCPGEAKLKETNSKKCKGLGGEIPSMWPPWRGTRNPATPSTPSSGSQSDISN